MMPPPKARAWWWEFLDLSQALFPVIDLWASLK